VGVVSEYIVANGHISKWFWALYEAMQFERIICQSSINFSYVFI